MTGASVAPAVQPARGPTGEHVSGGVFEAVTVLSAEGYLVGKVLDPASPFDLMAKKGNVMLLVSVVRPKEPVSGAREVTEQYRDHVRLLQKFYTSDADNLQFWVFSRKKGLLRYRVYDWGIGNEQTMQKLIRNPHD